MELFWEKKTQPNKQKKKKKKKTKKTRKYPKIDNSPFHSKASNGPICLANNDLRLPNMVSQ